MTKTNPNPKNLIAVFQGKKVRRVIHKQEWWFSVVDVVEALTDSSNPRDYWFKMKIRVKSEDKVELSTICRQLKLESADGKKYATDCANTEGIFRIVQSIPSPKAEPFKRWLARVGYEAGGRIAGNARKSLEQKTKKQVVTSQNYLRSKNMNYDKNLRVK